MRVNIAFQRAVNGNQHILILNAHYIYLHLAASHAQEIMHSSDTVIETGENTRSVCLLGDSSVFLGKEVVSRGLKWVELSRELDDSQCTHIYFKYLGMFNPTSVLSLQM